MTAYRAAGVVRFSETDASGRFHYSAALTWAENAEHALYELLKMPASAFPRRAISAVFESPLSHGDEYEVELQVDRLGRTSVTYTWRILDGATVAVTGSHTVVHVDGLGNSAPLPAALREILSPLIAPGSAFDNGEQEPRRGRLVATPSAGATTSR